MYGQVYLYNVNVVLYTKYKMIELMYQLDDLKSYLYNFSY